MPTIAELVALSSGLNHEGNTVVDNTTTATFDWGKAGWHPDNKPNSDLPPSGMTEITGYMHGYNVAGQPVVACNIFVRNMQTWVRAGGIWRKVEDSNGSQVLAGAYFTNMQTNSVSGPITFTNMGAGEFRLPSPPATQNGHWWLQPRGQLPAGVDATVCAAELRVDNAAASLIYGAGTDWWRAGSGWPANAASLAGSFLELTTSYRWICCTNLNEAELTVSRPEIVTLTGTPEPPPVEPDPVAITVTRSVKTQIFEQATITGRGKPGADIISSVRGSRINTAQTTVGTAGDWSVEIQWQREDDV